MVADMVAFVASQFTTSTWDVGAQELCSVVLIFLDVEFAAVRSAPDRQESAIVSWSPGIFPS